MSTYEFDINEDFDESSLPPPQARKSRYNAEDDKAFNERLLDAMHADEGNDAWRVSIRLRRLLIYPSAGEPNRRPAHILSLLVS